MADEAIDSLIERLLGETEVAADAAMPVDPAAAATLAAALDADSETASAAPRRGDPTAALAAYLEGGLDEAERYAVEAGLATSPTDFQEAAAALALLDAVASARAAAPRDLLDAVLAAIPAPAARPLPAPRPWWTMRSWQWSGAAAAAAVVVAIGLGQIGERVAPPLPTAPAVHGSERGAGAKDADWHVDAAPDKAAQTMTPRQPTACPPPGGAPVPARAEGERAKSDVAATAASEPCIVPPAAGQAEHLPSAIAPASPQLPGPPPTK
jgi:hypothetical protein